MAAKPVEWVLVVYYGPAAHQTTYGRQVRSGGYTKDYIQLSRKPEFLDAVANLFSVTASADGLIPLTYQWPAGTTSGAFVFRSADRPTSNGKQLVRHRSGKWHLLQVMPRPKRFQEIRHI